ncbi:MAG: methyltransferase, partial [Burkholderiales bacterium PBB5]
AAATLPASEARWRDAGLREGRSGQSTVLRQVDSFDDYWDSGAQSNTLRPMFNALPEPARLAVKAAVRQRLHAGDGPLPVSARATAVCGVRP